jgi:hypothetical protein
MKKFLLALVSVVVVLALVGVIYWQYKNMTARSAQPSITIISPDGGEVLKEGSTYTIKWETKNIPAANKISITIRRVAPPALPTEGQEFNPIVFINLENTGSKDWTVSDMYPEGNYIIEINSYASTPITNPISDESNAVFSIVKNQSTEEEYKNTQYGFSFSLPISWKGYSIVEDKWEGVAIGDDIVIEQGPIILIRNPEWTYANPMQDIPIMVFTIKQWDSLQQEKFHIGAAPIGPSELGRNSKYVFALPARYNYAFPTGWEEVDQILKNNPLKAF